MFIGDGFEPDKNEIYAGDFETRLKSALIFVGIYDQTILWERKFVKPVVDDALYGRESEVRGAERWTVGASLGVLWVWVLQREVGPLVLATGKGGLRTAVGCSGYSGWMVIFATLMVGFVRAVELVVWVVSVALRLMRPREDEGELTATIFDGSSPCV